MTLSGARKRCPSCQKRMQHWGKHPSGSIRWRCKACGKNAVRSRKDHREKKRRFLFVTWLTSKKTLDEVASLSGVTVKTICKWFEPLWSDPPKPRITRTTRHLVLDATSVAPRECMLLIAGDSQTRRPVSWLPVQRESLDVWQRFLYRLMLDGIEPSVVICDGQRGLLRAIREVWPTTKIQRCLIHVIRQSSLWLTQNPKSRAGRNLLRLVGQLSGIRTRRQKRRWIHAFFSWSRKHECFLKERTYGPSGRWWYTHRKLRGTKSLIQNALPDLFRYVSDPSVPRTSNHVEGGLNARLKELFRSHRGLSIARKLALASWYLALRQGQKTNSKG